MKQRFLKLFSLLLAGLCLFSGCGLGQGVSSAPVLNGSSSGEAGNGGTGMFVQTIISPKLDSEVYYTKMQVRADGTVLLIGRDTTGGARAFVGDGTGEWQETTNPTAADFIAQKQAIGVYPEFAIGADGTWWVAVSDFFEGDPSLAAKMPAQPQLVRIAAGGETDVFNVLPEDRSDAHYTLSGLTIGQDGTVYGFFNEDTHYTSAYWAAFDEASGKVRSQVALDATVHDTYSALIKGDKLYIPNAATHQMDVFSIENTSKLESISIPELNFGWDSICFDIASNGDFCYANNTGLHRVAQGGSLVQTMVSGTRYVFSSPEYWGRSLAALPNDSYLLLASDPNQSGVLYRFVFDETATIDMNNALTVWTLTDSHVLRAAVAEYGKAHPDVYISVEYGRSAGESGATDEDIIRTLNTRLLSGDVPDVLILDGLPADTYIARGMLTNLSGQINIDNCYENIMQSFTREGKTYAYPTLVELPLFMANAGDAKAKGVASLADLAGLATQKSALHYGSYEEMFEALYAAYGNNIFPGGAGVDEAALEDFLKNTKAISDALLLTNENDYIHGGMGNSGVLPRQGLASFTETNSQYAADILASPVSVVVLYSMSGPKAFSPLPGGSFIPVCAGAIPQGAQNPDMAAAFIEGMIQSDAVQFLNMDQGLSVRADGHLDYYKNRAADETSSPADLDWNGLFASFSGPANTEKLLQAKLYEQAQRLYAGQITLNDAIAGVVQNTKLYFQERA